MEDNTTAKPYQELLDLKWKSEEFTIQFPNNRKFRAIQLLKNQLGADLLADSDVQGQFISSAIEAEATLRVLAPKEFPTSWDDWSIQEIKEIVGFFSEKVQPWFTQNLNFIFSAQKELLDSNAKK